MSAIFRIAFSALSRISHAAVVRWCCCCRSKAAMIHFVNNIDTVDSHNCCKLHRLLRRIQQICTHFYVSDAVTCWSTHLKLLMTYYVPHNSLHLHIKFSTNFNVIVEASSCKLSHSPLPLLTLWHGHIYSKISDSNCSAQTKDWPKPPEGTEMVKN